MGHSFGSLKLQSVVSGNTFGPPEVCVRIETNVRRAQRCVSVGKRERSDRGLNLLCKERAGIVISATGRRRTICCLEPIAVNLPVDGMGRRGDAGLVEWNRYRLMNAMITDIPERQHHVVLGLPL